MGDKLTNRDIRHMRETWDGLQEPCSLPECNGACDCEAQPCERDACNGGCDCHASEIIMCSIGYVDVPHDGRVYAGGLTIDVDQVDVDALGEDDEVFTPESDDVRDDETDDAPGPDELAYPWNGRAPSAY